MTVDEITIREAREADISTLVEFLVELGLHVSGDRRQTLSRKARKRLKELLREFLEDTEKFMVVACTGDNQLVGMGNIQIWHEPSLWEEAEDDDSVSGFIDDLWVEPEYRRHGIMARILHALLDFAEARDINELILEYSITNTEAAGVWERLGFSPTGVRATATTKKVRRKLSSA